MAPLHATMSPCQSRIALTALVWPVVKFWLAASEADKVVLLRSSLGQQVARPFIKWVGGKRQLLAEILSRVPRRFGTFHEPFVGGGAVFFALKPKHAYLSDNNERLIRAYRGVRDDVERVIDLLKSYPHDKDFYLRFRALPIDAAPTDAEVAAWFIYLNRTGYNGLYRVNLSNGFNVPFGRYVNPKVCDPALLRACAAALRSADIFREDFSVVLERARPGDLVYFDPPYVPLSATSSFTSYTAGGFGLDQQRRLRDVALALKRADVFVLLSNSASPLVRELYGDDFTIAEVQASRMVNSKASGRGKLIEFLMW